MAGTRHLPYEEAVELLQERHGDPEDCWCCTGEGRGRHCELCHEEEGD